MKFHLNAAPLINAFEFSRFPIRRDNKGNRRTKGETRSGTHGALTSRNIYLLNLFAGDVGFAVYSPGINDLVILHRCKRTNENFIFAPSISRFK